MSRKIPPIDAELASRLVASQFPQWKGLPVRPVGHSGWDNRTFHLGSRLQIRLPSAADYATQARKEHRWLPRLAPALPLPIPQPLALGAPDLGYPWNWTISRWLPGQDANQASITDRIRFAIDLAGFVAALHRIDPTGGPRPGPGSFHRGGRLEVYDAQTRQALAALEGQLDIEPARRIWEAALATVWSGPPVWTHGDLAPGNLLVRRGRLSAVIDFGQLTVGDPACDLAIAWTFFQDESRAMFQAGLPLDPGTWARARGWALWKALIILAKLQGTDARGIKASSRILGELLADPEAVIS